MNVIIHPLAVLYILLSLIFDRFQSLFFLYIIGLVHELSHVLSARVFSVKTQEILLYPTGFLAKIDDIDKLKISRQLIIILSGPLSFILSYFIAYILFYFKIISVYGLREFNELNLIVLIFNLLPCYPLDGGKIFDIIIAHLFNEYITRIIRIILSSIIIFSLILISRSLGDFIFISFLVVGVFSSIINFKKEYILFLLKRKFSKNMYSPKINSRIEIYRYRNNYLINSKKEIVNEGQIIDQLFKINNSSLKS